MSISQSNLWPPAPSTTRGSSVKLGASPDGSLISYGSGRTAVIRPIHSGGPSLMFGHAAPVTVARISPTGFYCASGDTAGNIRVFDTTPGGTMNVKFESKPLARVNDVAWDGEGKRFVVVGEGRGSFGAAFSLDTGAGIGEISGSSKTLNACAMRPGRPFRAVTGSDDFSVCMMNGVPFKFTSTSRQHTRFVQSVGYAPDGSSFVSAGSDGQAFLYDGLTGESLATLENEGKNAHTGTIYSAAFSPDSKNIVTSSADATTKLWDVATRKVVSEWKFAGESLQSQQVGNVFARADTIVSLSFSGVLNVLDPRSPTPTRHIYGHQNPVGAITRSADSKTFFSGDSSGCIRRWTSDGICEPVEGAGHIGLVVDIVQTKEGKLATTGYDDSLKLISEDSGFDSASLATGAVPKGLSASSAGLLFLLTSKDLQVISSTTKLTSLALSYDPSCVAVNTSGTVVAVGGQDSQVRLYALEKDVLTLSGTLELRNPITSLAFSPDSTKLAVGDSTGKVPLYHPTSLELISSRFVHQSGRVNVLRWNEEGSKIAAGSLDESIRVYSLEKPSQVLAAKNAHRGGCSSLVWTGDSQLVSSGADGSIKTFEISL